MTEADELRVSHASYLAAAVRRVNVAHQEIGSPQIYQLDQLWTVLSLELETAERAGDEDQGDNLGCQLPGRQAIDRYEQQALDLIGRHR